MAIRIDNLPLSGSDNRIILTNSSISRKFDFGNSWNRVRIGIRWNVNYSGLPLTKRGAISGTPEKAQFDLYVGLMSEPTSGLTDGPLGTNTNNFVGYYTNEDFEWLEYITTMPYYYYNASEGAFTYGKKVGITKTSFNGNAGAIRIPAFPKISRSIVMIEFHQTSNTSVGAKMWYPAGGAPTQRDYSTDELIAAMKIPDDTAAKNYLGLLTGTATNYLYTPSNLSAFDQTLLDSLVIAWSGNWSPLIISDILWAKME